MVYPYIIMATSVAIVAHCATCYFSYGVVQVCEIELSHMSKNNGNHDFVCEKYLFLDKLTF